MTTENVKELMALSKDIYSQLELDDLSRGQRLFVLRFDGRRPAEVAADAGYNHPAQAASRLMSNPKVQKNIAIVSKALERSIIASKLDVLKFWTDVMFGVDPNFGSSDRMKASENLGKIHRLLGPDIIRAEVQNNNIQVVIQSPEPTSPQEVIEMKRLEHDMNQLIDAELLSMGNDPQERQQDGVYEPITSAQ